MRRESSFMVDSETGATVVVQNEIKANHAGRLFTLMGYETKAITETIEIIGETPAGTRKSHITFSVQGTDGVVLEVYEGPTTIAGGTPATPINMNRASSNVSEVTALIDPASIGADGDLIFAQSVGADKDAGTIPSGVGFVLAPGTKYLYRITSLGNDNVISYRGIWAEVKKWQEER